MSILIIIDDGIPICLGDVDSEAEAEEVTKEWIETHPKETDTRKPD